ncbi:purple acid phosphatase family protein [Salinactinospora qingdaonensis]|uniref:Metallophosphoesterase family protein n=1 Tax=Salinactinospora qingdaonensis TaxID=702744 RepID=A0ABP7FPF2_9ACTN
MSASPHTSRLLPRRALAVLGGLTLALAPAVTATPAATAAAAPERLALSPTADPSDSQTVTWRTSGEAEAVLEIAPAATPDQVQVVQGERTGSINGGVYHRATVSGLTPDTTYRYRVGDGADAVSEWQTFTTAAETAQPFDFLYFGDVQNDITEGAAPVIEAALADASEAELAVHPGDLINTAESDSEWAEWYDAFGTEATAGMNHVTTPGNHEYKVWSVSDYWPLQFPGAGNGPDDDDLENTVYYTDYQGVRFISLNANYVNAPWLDIVDWLEDQEYWLRTVLENNPNDWTVVTFHQPMFSNEPDRSNGPLRWMWLDVLEEYNVDLVLQGHDHSYGRGNLTANRTDDPAVQTGPVYVVAVTGPKMYDVDDSNWVNNGAEARVQLADTQTYQVVSVDGNQMDYVAKTIDGSIVDSFTITKDAESKRVTDTNVG